VSTKRSYTSQKKNINGKLKIIQNIQNDVSALLRNGMEDEALDLHQECIQVADAEVTRILSKISKNNSSSEANIDEETLQRWQSDVLKLSIVIGKIRTKMAMIHEHRGDHDRAVESCREARSIYLNQPTVSGTNDSTADTRSLAQLMDMMIARLVMAQKGLEGRQKQLEEIDQLREAITTTDNPTKKKNLYEQVERIIHQMKTTETEILGKKHPQVAETFQLLSTIALEQGKNGEALRHLSDAIEINKDSLGEKHPRTCMCYLRVARIHASSGRDGIAMQYFEEATSGLLLQASLKYEHVLGSAYNDIGVINMRRRDYKTAIVNFMGSIEHYDTALLTDKGNKPGEVKDCALAIDSVQALRNLGECYLRTKDFQSAKEMFEKVLDLQRSTRKVYDVVKDLELELLGVERFALGFVDDKAISDSFIRLGRAQAAEMKHEEALASFVEAFSLLSNDFLVDELNNNMDDKERQHQKEQLASTKYCIAEELKNIGRHDEAIGAYSESIRLRSSDDMEAKVIHCTLCFIGIGNSLLSKGDVVTSYNHFSKTLEYCRANGTPDDHSLVAVIEQKLKEIQEQLQEKASASETQLCEVENNVKQAFQEMDYDKAISSLNQVLALRREALKSLRLSGKDESEEVHAIACWLRCLGSAFARIGDEENADRAYTDATILFNMSGAQDEISI
jgi:tetratricopeptide (TPR) repeat protein